MTILNKTSEIRLLIQVFGGELIKNFVDRSEFAQPDTIPQILFNQKHHGSPSDSAIKFQSLLEKQTASCRLDNMNDGSVMIILYTKEMI